MNRPNDLTGALTDIARSQTLAPAAQPPTLHQAIMEAFEFYRFIHEPPELNQANYHARNRIIGAYIRSCPAILSDLSAEFENFTVENWCRAFDGDFLDAAAVIRSTALTVVEKPINKTIEQLWNAYCQAYGIFRSNGPDEPDELVGFRENE